MYGQSVNGKIMIGNMYYQGDLAPQTTKLSFGPAHFSWGLGLGYDINSWVSLNLSYLEGSLSGDDSFADSQGRRERNLSFKSSINELALFSSVKINHLLPFLDKYRLRFYAHYGFNYLRFDPQTRYNGQWVRLQPLGTEGQFLANSKNPPYSLNSISMIMGASVEFDVYKNISFGLEIIPRKTFTDYLDDVSTYYPGFDILASSDNLLGAQLSNRTGEYFGTENILVESGKARGRSDKDDWYTYMGLYVKIKLFEKKAQRLRILPDDSILKQELDSEI